MRSPAAGQQRSRRLEIKMTPMIDVVFLLLIFFVCTTTFQEPEEILPTQLLAQGIISESDLEPEDPLHEPIVVKLRVEGGYVRWLINNVSIEHFSQVRDTLMALSQIRQDVPIILDPDVNVPVGDVIDLYDLCRMIGFEKIQFAAKVDS